jgi:hypothetical protein
MIFSKRALYVIAAFFSGFQLISQNSTQSILFSEWNRSAQLSGLVSDSIPIGLLKTTVFQDSLNPFTYSKKIVSKKNVELAILPLVQQYEYNSNYPFGWGNGSMKKSKGLQGLTSLGISGRIGPLHFQLQPEFTFSQNATYQGFPEEYPFVLWGERFNDLYDKSDQPGYFGNGWNTFKYWGQSDIHLKLWKLNIGVGNQQKWWGPGQEHALIFSNNAPGFVNAYIKTQEPINIGIGQFNGEIFVGRLEGSGFVPVRTANTTISSRFIQKSTDWRYLTGMNISFQPKFFSGLEIGFIRTIQQYYESTKINNDYMPLFISVTRRGTGNIDDEIDQQASAYMRLVLPAAQSEIYLEVGRNDSPFNLRDVLMAPRHSLGYLYGIIKQFDILNVLFEIGYEGVHMERSGTFRFRPEPSWYLNGLIEHGYAHHGEFLGVGLPAGSNAQHFSIDLIKPNYRYGIVMDRIANEMDFYKEIQANYPSANPWIDWAIGASGQIILPKLTLTSTIKGIKSFNYQWIQKETINNSGNSLKGNPTNLFFSLKTTYSF